MSPTQGSAGCYRLVYISCSTEATAEASLEGLLMRARPANARLGISGFLLYSDGHYLQMLEGARDAVETLFARIAADRRHREVTVVLRENVSGRALAGWYMAGILSPAAEMRARFGLVSLDQLYGLLDQSRFPLVRALVSAFAAQVRVGQRTATVPTTATIA